MHAGDFAAAFGGGGNVAHGSPQHHLMEHVEAPEMMSAAEGSMDMAPPMMMKSSADSFTMAGVSNGRGGGRRAAASARRSMGSEFGNDATVPDKLPNEQDGMPTCSFEIQHAHAGRS